MTKEVIVLLPGYDGNGNGTFSKLSQLLSKKYNCIIINYPYYLQTNHTYTLSELNRYLNKLIKDRHHTKFHLLGFSMGGFVATSYALTHPRDILSLTLVSSSARPHLSYLSNLLLSLAYYLFKVTLIAKLFSIAYTSKLLRPLTKVSPLPLPRENFPSDEGYPVFGTLANVMQGSINSNTDNVIEELNCPKRAILFKDDSSFPADTYAPILTNLGFRVIVKNTGGHAVSPDYWDKVSDSLYR